MVNAVLRLPAVRQKYPRSRSSIYNDIDLGTFPPPIALGSNCVAWPENEVDAVIAARVAGKSDDEVRRLVKMLVAERKGKIERKSA